MNDEDKIIKEFVQKIQQMDERPDSKLWKKIEYKVQKRQFSILKTATIVGAIVIAAIIIAIIFAPEQKDNSYFTKQTTKQEKSITSNLSFTTSPSSSIKAKKTTSSIIDKTITENNDEINHSTYIAPNYQDNKLQINTTATTPTNNTTTSNNPLKSQNNTSTSNNYKNVQQSNKAIKTDNNTPNIDSVIMLNELVIPNAFQPSSLSDKINTFKPAYRELKSYRMDIYSKNGIHIFTSNDIAIGWDGKIEGKDGDMGIYIYVIVYRDKESVQHTQKGKLMLVR